MCAVQVHFTLSAYNFDLRHFTENLVVSSSSPIILHVLFVHLFRYFRSKNSPYVAAVNDLGQLIEDRFL